MNELKFKYAAKFIKFLANKKLSLGESILYQLKNVKLRHSNYNLGIILCAPILRFTAMV